MDRLLFRLARLTPHRALFRTSPVGAPHRTWTSPVGARSLSGFPGTPTGRRLVNADGTPRVCLISGAASGIGRASALRIASEGGIPIIADLLLQEAAGKKVKDQRAGVGFNRQSLVEWVYLFETNFRFMAH
jgi:hypothetical protein